MTVRTLFDYVYGVVTSDSVNVRQEKRRNFTPSGMDKFLVVGLGNKFSGD
jgi:hypothetical protein